MAADYAMSEEDWDLLLERIQAGRCTPFIGAGAARKHVPVAAKIAEEWAKEHNYPMEDKDSLMRVAQYLAVQRDSMFPKENLIKRWFSQIKYPNLAGLDDPHSILAALPLSIYITTNYDHLMYHALDDFRDQLGHRVKTPRREVCRWNRQVEKKLRRQMSIFKDDQFEPDPTHPVVFHLHGDMDLPESLVLTEDDYIDFLVRVSEDKENLLPPCIQEAIADTSLLFIGYSLNDLNFRVLFQGIISKIERSQKRNSFTLQFPLPKDASVVRYIEDYFEKMMDIHVIWGDANDFTRELYRRWEALTNGS